MYDVPGALVVTVLLLKINILFDLLAKLPSIVGVVLVSSVHFGESLREFASLIDIS